jgi:uncharacterized protein (TIGR00369 family)
MDKAGRKVNRCFACGPDNPDGLQLKFVYDAKEHSVRSRVVIDPKYQGATGFAHGGITAMLLDEAMAKVNGLGGTRAVTIRLHVSYRKMLPVSEVLNLTGRLVRRRGRRIYLRSEVRDAGGRLCAEARAMFLEVPHSNMFI